jgi:hypothetical protein
MGDWRSEIAKQRKLVGEKLATAKAEVGRSIQTQLKYMSPEDKKKWEDRHATLSNAQAKSSKYASNITNTIKGHVATASEKINNFKNNITPGVSTATLNASSAEAKSALSRIEQICAKYKKTAGRRKKTLRKRR